ncbi:DUF2069 domain-containing protein [Uliginosibacterium sp. TH139]|uniref:DUF2069 domain-containing protein n=1 Tax=Uliginosibacterium sp. TH139 TaxID=2067453 RepID=UPI000C7DE397|nr:DUF2069 domain-containing protein [Uliginosibacterium sp. TH139]PLK47057.1 DUF2069 domain-containing protein [Uliginosibacterium sp. TH139]
MPSLSVTRTAATVCLLALIALCLAAELWLAPLRPGGSWLVLKVLPLLAALPGFLKGRRYTFQWMSLAIWIYFTFGVVSASTVKGIGAVLGGCEALLALAIFCLCALFARQSAPSRQKA